MLHAVSRRAYWEDAAARSEPLLRVRVQDLVEKLGYEIEVRARYSVLHSSEGRALEVV